MDKCAALVFSRKYLDYYYKKHACSIKDVISSQWTRGVLSGRVEALNILKEAIEKESK